MINQLAEDIINAQADLQSALGILRLSKPLDSYIEEKLARSLATLHRALLRAGRPMATPARHPDVAYPTCVGEHNMFGSNPHCLHCGLRPDRELPL